jgi:Predicted periplasmic protein
MIELFGFKILTASELAELQKPKEPMYVHDIILNRAPINKSGVSLPRETLIKLKETSDKYPPVSVTYAGTPKKGSVVYPIDVKNYAECGQNDDALIQFLKSKKLTVDEKVVSKLTYHELCDEMVAKINQATPVTYAFDTDNYGFSEYWQFAPLTFKIGNGDCDDYAILRYVLYRLAGVPAELIRIGVGLTANGQGHATIYYLSSSLEWLHLNSTSSFSKAEDSVEKQTLKDASLAIQDFWFSFNELSAWSKLESKAALESFESQPKFKISENKGSNAKISSVKNPLQLSNPL